MTEPELLALLECHDRLVKSCLSGDISIEQFLEHYDDFPLSYALDGHESSESERALLERHRERVQFHFGVLDCLRGLSREEDAGTGRAEGFRRLQNVCETWLGNSRGET